MSKHRPTDRTRLRTPWLDVEPGPRDRRPSARPATGRDDHRRPVDARPQKPLDLSPPARTPGWVSATYALTAMMTVAGVMLAVGGNKQAIGAVVSGILLFILMRVIARRLAALDNNPQLVPILMGAFCLKLVGALVRYWIAADYYKTGDFYDYDNWGKQIAYGLRHGHLVHVPGRLAGTAFMRYVTGFIYFVTPARLLSGFFVYAFLSFIGLLFFWRAYRVAVSDTNDVRYLKWIVLLPSLLYWPSAIGKDAFMVLAAGIASYGAARLITGSLGPALVALTLGIAGTVFVRPHVALVVCAGLILAVFVGRKQHGIGTTLLSIGLVIGVALVALHSASSFFGVSGFNPANIAKTLSDVSNKSGQGGSAFTPIIANNPIKFLGAAVTVLFRPFPFEAHSPPEMATAIEGLVLFIMTIKTFKRSVRALKSSRTKPYFAYAFGALLLFIFAFSGISNFGILARQRSVIEPLLLVFLTLPKDSDDVGPRTTSRQDRSNDRFVRPPKMR
jgi:hypothetical protein